MKKNVVFIDDELQKDDPPVILLEKIIEECGFKLKVLNKKKEIESFINAPYDETGMVLLDRDLSKIDRNKKITPIKILEKLDKREIPVFVLSQLQKQDKKAKEDFRTLTAKGVRDFIHKDRMDEKVFMSNLITSAVKDVDNDRFKLVVRCDNAEVMLIEREPKTVIGSIDFSSITNKWKTKQTMPSGNKYNKEIIFRILYEMGKRKSTKISIKNIYSPFPNKSDEILLNKAEAEKLYDLNEKLNDYLIKKKGRVKDEKVVLNINETVQILRKLKDTVGDVLVEIYEREDKREKKKERRINKLHVNYIDELLSSIRSFDDDVLINYMDEISEVISDKITLPTKFSDERGKFNKEIIDISKGRIIGNILMGEPGKNVSVYSINIGGVELYEPWLIEETLSDSWKETVEKRLSSLEKEIKNLKKHISS